MVNYHIISKSLLLLGTFFYINGLILKKKKSDVSKTLRFLLKLLSFKQINLYLFSRVCFFRTLIIPYLNLYFYIYLYSLLIYYLHF